MRRAPQPDAKRVANPGDSRVHYQEHVPERTKDKKVCQSPLALTFTNVWYPPAASLTKRVRAHWHQSLFLPRAGSTATDNASQY